MYNDGVGLTINDTGVRLLFSIKAGNQIIKMNPFYNTSTEEFEIVSYESDNFE
jgi:hypothetical protein